MLLVLFLGRARDSRVQVVGRRVMMFVPYFSVANLAQLEKTDVSKSSTSEL
jgi:hypothetical protein